MIRLGKERDVNKDEEAEENHSEGDDDDEYDVHVSELYVLHIACPPPPLKYNKSWENTSSIQISQKIKTNIVFRRISFFLFF